MNTPPPLDESKTDTSFSITPTSSSIQPLFKVSTTPVSGDISKEKWLTQQFREPCDISSETPTDPRLLQLADAYSTISSLVGEDLSRGGILNTPMRAAKAIMELTVGYEHDLDTIVNNAVFDEDCDELVIVRDIEFNSLCEHHLLPFSGRAHIGYLPAGRILGLSKLARITDMFAKRFQVQERLTKQICIAVDHVVAPLGAIVMIEAEHSCMSCRGVEKSGSSTITVSQTGIFRDQKKREEFFSLINRPSKSRF